MSSSLSCEQTRYGMNDNELKDLQLCKLELMVAIVEI